MDGTEDVWLLGTPTDLSLPGVLPAQEWRQNISQISLHLLSAPGLCQLEWRCLKPAMENNRGANLLRPPVSEVPQPALSSTSVRRRS
jgi:hypothetical protein